MVIFIIIILIYIDYHWLYVYYHPHPYYLLFKLLLFYYFIHINLNPVPYQIHTSPIKSNKCNTCHVFPSFPHSHLYINSELVSLIKEMDPIHAIIVNKHQDIQMQCPSGSELGQSCSLKWDTIMCIYMDMVQLRCVYYPRGICIRHKHLGNNECRVWDYFDKKGQGVLGENDVFMYLPKIVRGIRWPLCRNIKNSLCQFSTRYKFSLELYQDFLKTIIVNSYVKI